MDGALPVLDDQPLPVLDGPITTSVHQTSTYRIHVTSDETSAWELLAEVIDGHPVVMVTDETVDKLYAGRIAEFCPARRR